ncbi:hypothetical protein GCM10010271_68840 [Streptomyces kurssanovii]|nr:hypothetical protein GCM10010271_68840 [Streptomyces kurssanovii]
MPRLARALRQRLQPRTALKRGIPDPADTVHQHQLSPVRTAHHVPPQAMAQLATSTPTVRKERSRESLSGRKAHARENDLHVDSQSLRGVPLDDSPGYGLAADVASALTTDTS